MYAQPLKLFWLWLFPLILSANFVHWKGDYTMAHQKALHAHKPLLVLLVKKDSSRSGDMIKHIFMDQPYIDTINEKAVAVIVTYEGKQNYPVEMYYATYFPALFFVDSSKEVFLSEPLYGKAISVKMMEEKVRELLK